MTTEEELISDTLGRADAPDSPDFVPIAPAAMPEPNIDIEALLREAGPRICSPEVQAEADALFDRGAPPLTPEFRQRLIAAAERGLRNNRERGRDARDGRDA